MANEERLIDANAALEKLCEYCICGCYEQCEERCVEFHGISKLPTVDAVKVVRCKECLFSRYFEESGTRKCRTMQGLYRTVDDDDFCSYGERREGE